MKKSSKILVVIIILIMIILCVGIYYYLTVSNFTSGENKFNKKNIVGTGENKVVGKVYAINNIDVYIDDVILDSNQKELVLYEYNDSNKDYAEIYYIFTSYTTEPAYEYVLNVTDEEGNSLLIDDTKPAIGTLDIAKIEKISLNQKINFSFVERVIETQEKTKEVRTTINLEKDLSDIEEIDQIQNVEESRLGDINFKYVKDDTAGKWPLSSEYSTELVGEIFVSTIQAQYGNSLYSCGSFVFDYLKNVNNLTLDDAFESLDLITKNAGEYGLSDFYGLDIKDENDNVVITVIVSFDEMIDLCNGLTIEKDGVKYNKSNFAFESSRIMENVEKVEIGDGIEAIKYSYRYPNQDIEENYYYLFEYNNNIYDLVLPADERVAEEVEYILESLEFVE